MKKAVIAFICAGVATIFYVPTVGRKDRFVEGHANYNGDGCGPITKPRKPNTNGGGAGMVEKIQVTVAQKMGRV